MALTEVNSKRCKVCGKWFIPFSTTKKVCSTGCAIILMDDNRAAKERKAWRKEQKLKKEKLKTKRDHLKEAQKEFNAYIRERDKGNPCISCNKHHPGQIHAGHYRSVGACPELRFNEDNCHAQCAPCNNHKSGDIINYRINLIDKIGDDRLSNLEGPHPMPNWSIDEIIGFKKEFKQKLKALK